MSKTDNVERTSAKPQQTVRPVTCLPVAAGVYGSAMTTVNSSPPK
jgi:hypothetical protein